jgi:hypothetical protein
MVAVLIDALNFELLFPINQLRRRSRVVRSVRIGFMIGAQKRGVEYIVDVPGQG